MTSFVTFTQIVRAGMTSFHTFTRTVRGGITGAGVIFTRTLIISCCGEGGNTFTLVLMRVLRLLLLSHHAFSIQESTRTARGSITVRGMTSKEAPAVA